MADRTDSFPGSTDELLTEIDRLTKANLAEPSEETERELLRLRHIAGLRRRYEAEEHPDYPEPDFARLPTADPLPEFSPADVTPALLRAGILRDGCLLVRGLVPAVDAQRFAADIERSFAEREHRHDGQRCDARYYSEFTPDPRVGQEWAEKTISSLGFTRPWVKEGGGVLAVDAPMLCFRMLELFRRAGVQQLVHGYLDETPLISGEKTTLRKAEPDVPGAWHQDGKFMGKVRALNMWLSLSRCGDEAPGLDIVPRRLQDFVTTETDEAAFNHMISQRQAEEAAGETPILRPIFNPGDALFFDDVLLHKTGSDPSMPKPRFAVESWFFGGSEFPTDYAPIAV